MIPVAWSTYISLNVAKPNRYTYQYLHVGKEKMKKKQKKYVFYSLMIPST